MLKPNPNRRYKKLSPLSNNKLKYPDSAIFVDTEADNISYGTQRLRFGVAKHGSWDLYSNDWRERGSIIFHYPMEFWNWVDSICVARSKTTWVLCHNWNYDGSILDTFHNMERLGWVVGTYINEGRPPVIVKARRNRHNLILVDTLNFFHSSLKRLGDSIGLPKLDMPMEIEKTKGESGDWLGYAERDVDILIKAITEFRRFLIVEGLGSMATTIASQAMTIYRQTYQVLPLEIHAKTEALHLERQSYMGGRVDAFWAGRVTGDLYKIDVNSMYPTVMKNNRLPYRLIYHFKGDSPHNLADFHNNTDSLGITAKVLLKTEDDVYPLKHEGKLVFPVGTFETVLTTPEYLHAYNNGHIEEVREFCLYDTATLFSRYVDSLYALRRQFEAKKNSVFAYACKILLNSLYGKFGQNGRKWVNDKFISTHIRDGYYSPTGDVGDWYSVRRRGLLNQRLEEFEEDINSIPSIAAHITGYARMALWGIISHVRKFGGVVYYCDTDGLIVDDAGYRIAKPYIGKELGQLSLEGTAKECVIYGAKDYVFGDDVKIKGIRQPVAGKRVYEQPMFRSWDYHLEKDREGEIDVLKIIKHLTETNTKRVVMGVDSPTQPLRFDG